MSSDDNVRVELRKYLNLASEFNIELNGKNFVDLIELLGGAYYEY